MKTEQPDTVYSTAPATKAQTAARPLADVLWEAANTWLHPKAISAWYHEGRGGCSYSCHAIQAAIFGKAPQTSFQPWLTPDSIRRFLGELGCTGSSSWAHEMNKRHSAKTVQGVRYMWLLLAMHVAEDEGVTV